MRRRIGRSQPPGSFETLVSPHLERLYRLAFRFTGSREDAEDLVQELCVRLYPQTGKLRGLDKPGPWLARALHNLFIDSARRKVRDPVDAESDPPDLASDAPGPEQQALAGLEVERIERALARLPPEQRAVLAWHDIEGYTLEELAEQSDVPIGTLKSRLHRARARLRQILMEPFPAPDRVRE